MVSIVGPCAALTVETCAVPVPGIHIPAPVAPLTRVGRVNHDDANTISSRLVSGELLQLTERPLVEHVAAALAGLSAFSGLSPNVGQVLKRYRLNVGAVRKPFRHTVVNVSDEPLFPATHRLQSAMRGTGAFFLQSFPIVRVLAFRPPDFA